VLRYFSPQPTDWQDEFSVFLLIGVTFLSSAWVQAERGHIGIEALQAILPPRVDRVRLRLVDAASALFCAFFAWKSWTLLHEAWVEGHVSSSSWAPPLWIPYLAMALGMSLLTLQILLQLVRRP
jgi:TRAP-type C4-dicarboxylate transport system permease small subunit